MERGCGLGGVELADNGEQHLFLFGEVRLEIGADGGDELGDVGELVVAAGVDAGDLGGQGIEAGELLVEVPVMGGFEVVDQLGGAHRCPAGLLACRCRLELVEDLAGVEPVGDAGLGVHLT